MPVEVIMPKVDMDMTSGTFAVWHVEEGATVAKGEPLFDIETDKSAMEVEAPASGTLHHLIAQPGERIDVGMPVAWIYAERETVGERPGAVAVQLPAARPIAASAPPEPALTQSAAPDPARAAPEPATPPPVALAPAAAAASSAPSLPDATEMPRATPAARRLAREGGVEVGAVIGTGPHGRVQHTDVEQALATRAAHQAPAPLATTVADVPAPAARPTATEALPVVPWAAQAGALRVSRRKGSGTPLLLIHGFAADSMGWAPFERELPRDLPLIRIDLPSHGASPRRRMTGLKDLLQAVIRAFDEACDGPVHLLGHSLGGAVALALADIRPRQVASLTLLAPAGLGPEIDAAALNGIARATRAESLAPWLQRLTATPDAISWDFARAAMLSRTDPDLRSAQIDLADVLFPDGVQSFDLRAALARVTAPTAIVWGRDDRILPWRHALAATGDMALHLLHGVGHIPHVERPADLARIVARHLGHV